MAYEKINLRMTNTCKYYMATVFIGLLLSVVVGLVLLLAMSLGWLSQSVLLKASPVWIMSIVLLCVIVLSFLIAYFLKHAPFSNLPLYPCFELFDSLGRGIIITDCDNKIIYVNAKYITITGFSYDDVLGKNPSISSSGQHSKTFYKQLWNALHEQGYWEGEIWNRRKNGESYPEWIQINVIRDKHKKVHYYLGIFSDITYEKAKQEKIKYYAFYDPLTNLPNRRFFIEQLETTLATIKRTGKKIAVLFIDLDDFKSINDHFGHQVGDAYLQKVGLLLKNQVRESDMVSRFGGDEFLMLLTNFSSKKTLSTFIEPFISSLNKTIIDCGGHRFSFKASIGVAVGPDDGSEADVLIAKADEIMYQNKLKKNHY